MERIFAKGANIIEGIAKKAVGFADDVLQSLDKLISLIKKGSQSFASFIRQVLDDFFEWLKGLFKSGKADEVFEGGINKKLFSIWKINAKKGKLNCANCAIAVDATLAGNPASALPWTYQKVLKNGKLIDIVSYDKGTNFSVLENFFDKKFTGNITIDSIKGLLKPGQKGIIFAYKKNSTIGHFFNVVNENGVVKFLDGQSGKSADLIYDVYRLLPTNF